MIKHDKTSDFHGWNPLQISPKKQQVALDFRELTHAHSTWGMMQMALSLGWKTGEKPRFLSYETMVIT